MAEINVTPFADVMLVRLIIFMVTAPLLTAGVPVDLPDSRANALDSEPQGVTISIDETGNVFIDDAPVAIGGFARALESLPRGRWRRRRAMARRTADCPGHGAKITTTTTTAPVSGAATGWCSPRAARWRWGVPYRCPTWVRGSLL